MHQLDQAVAPLPYFDHYLDQDVSLQRDKIAEISMQRCQRSIQRKIKVKRRCHSVIQFAGWVLRKRRRLIHCG
jgi:hypothetical protein